LKWTVVTSKRKFEVKAKRKADAEREAWKLAEKGEEILFVVPKFPSD
jgi:hypothetical protein